MLSRTSSRVRPSWAPSTKTRENSAKLVESWSSIQAARPTGESAIPVQRLGVGPQLECVGHVCREEVPQLLVEAGSLVVETGRRRAAGRDRRCDVGSDRTREVGVEAD